MTRKRMPRGIRILSFTMIISVALVIATMIMLNVFLNVWLRAIINRHPQRLKMTYDVAWTFRPDKVEVKDLLIRQQSPRAQVLIRVDHATITFDLRDFSKRIVHITSADAQGGGFRWRARVDAPPRIFLPSSTVVGVPATDVEPETTIDAVPSHEDATPPIPGLTNPPNPAPEGLYPKAKPWRVMLEEVHLDGIREIWISDYHYLGDATISGALTVEARKWIEAEGVVLHLNGGQVTRGNDSVLTGIQGQVFFELVGTNPLELERRGIFGSVSGKVLLTGDVANLSFLDFYLQSASWLHLTGGIGQLCVDVVFQDGAFMDGSAIAADVDDIVVHILSYSAIGDGEVRLAVGTVDGAPQSTISIDFLEFAINHASDNTAHVQGQGFRVSASTSDVALDRPFTSLDVVLNLPEAEIPDLSVYNVYMPQGIGLKLLGGTGTVSGFMKASTPENICQAELLLKSSAVRVTLDQLVMSGDIALHALIPVGNIGTGEYDISGTSLDLRRIRVISRGSTREGKDDSSGWWASLQLPKGNVAIGNATFLDGNFRGQFRDTIPFITIFSEKKPLPRWVRSVLGVGPVSGRARFRLGDDVLRVSNFHMFAGKFEVLMELRRRRDMVGKLYARYGILSLGMSLARDGNEYHLFRSRKWYDSEPNPG